MQKLSPLLSGVMGRWDILDKKINLPDQYSGPGSTPEPAGAAVGSRGSGEPYTSQRAASSWQGQHRDRKPNMGREVTGLCPRPVEGLAVGLAGSWACSAALETLHCT